MIFLWSTTSESAFPLPAPQQKNASETGADTVVQGAGISLQPHLYCFIDMLMTKYIPRSYEVQNKSEIRIIPRPN